MKDIKRYLEESNSKIKDHDVVNGDDISIALSKNDFAENILSGISPFNELDLSAFEPVFERIKVILSR